MNKKTENFEAAFFHLKGGLNIVVSALEGETDPRLVETRRALKSVIDCALRYGNVEATR